MIVRMVMVVVVMIVVVMIVVIVAMIVVAVIIMSVTVLIIVVVLMVLMMRMVMRLMLVPLMGDHAVLVMLGIDRMIVGLGCRKRLRVAGDFDHLALDTVAVAAAAGIAVARAAAMAAVLVLFLGLAMGALVGFDQRLTVGDRDLVIIGMDFAKGQEAVPVAAILDEGSL